jgi:hypothetical protein
MPVRKVSTRSALTVAGAAVAAVLAALLALVVNFGILRAAGSPPGPGRLDRTSVERSVPSASPRPERRTRAHEDRATPSPARPSESPSFATVAPSPDRSSPSPDGGQREREFGSHADD